MWKVPKYYGNSGIVTMFCSWVWDLLIVKHMGAPISLDFRKNKGCVTMWPCHYLH